MKILLFSLINICFLFRGATEEENVKAVIKDGPVEGVIDFVGASPTLSTGLKCLCRSGTLVNVGAAGGKITEDGLKKSKNNCMVAKAPKKTKK